LYPEYWVQKPIDAGDALFDNAVTVLNRLQTRLISGELAMFPDSLVLFSCLRLIRILGGGLVLFGLLTEGNAASAPNARIVRELSLNDRLVVKSENCELTVKTQSETKIIIRCITARSVMALQNYAEDK